MPRLAALESVAARTFLREYANYAKRVEGAQGMVPMCRCLDDDDLEALAEATEGAVEVLPLGMGAHERVLNRWQLILKERVSAKERLWKMMRILFRTVV